MNADLIVVPELPQLPLQYNGLWVGENRNMGLAIIPNRTTKLVQVTDIPELSSNVILADVTGSISFLLLAVWAKKETKYVEGLHRALDLCEKHMASRPTVVLGDFNSNTIWDDKHNRKNRGVSHTDLVRRLNDLGLVSAYHSHFIERHGQERQPTLYFRKEEKRTFHIDYCFVPKTWTVTGVTVGSCDDWKAVSDHMPLVVEVEEQISVNCKAIGSPAATSVITLDVSETIRSRCHRDGEGIKQWPAIWTLHQTRCAGFFRQSIRRIGSRVRGRHRWNAIDRLIIVSPKIIAVIIT